MCLGLLICRMHAYSALLLRVPARVCCLNKESTPHTIALLIICRQGALGPPATPVGMGDQACVDLAALLVHGHAGAGHALHYYSKQPQWVSVREPVWLWPFRLVPDPGPAKGLLQCSSSVPAPCLQAALQPSPVGLRCAYPEAAACCGWPANACMGATRKPEQESLHKPLAFLFGVVCFE
jgi:hypothetical protein